MGETDSRGGRGAAAIVRLVRARVVAPGAILGAILGAAVLAWLGLCAGAGAGVARAENVFSPADGLVSPLAGTKVSGVSASANVDSAGATQVLYTVTFKAEHELAASTGYVTLTAPAGAVFNTNGNSYEVIDGASKAQSGHVQVDPEGGGENVVNVYIPGSFTVKANDTVTIEAYGVKNPTSADSGAKLSVATSADTEPVSMPFPIEAPSEISGLSVSASTTSAGASSVLYTASFKSTSAISSGNAAQFGDNEQPGYIRLTAPQGTVFNIDGDSYEVSDEHESKQATHVTVNPDGLGENVVDVNVPPSFEASVSAGETVTIEAYGAKNPTSEVPAGQLSVSTTSDVQPVSTPLPIGPETEVGDPSIGSLGGAYTVRFATRSNVSNGDYEQFGDNEQPGYVQVSLPGATMPSSAGDYTFTVTSVQHGTQESGVLHVEASGETVRVKPRQTIEAGSLVTLQIAGVTGNPTASALISTSSDAKPVSVGSTPLAPLSGTVTYNKTPVSGASVQACRTPSGACLTTSTNPSGQFTFGVPATAGASYALTANPPASFAAAQGRIPRVTIPGAAGVTGIDLALSTPGKIAEGVAVVSAGHGEQTSATSDPVKFWGEPYELKLSRSLFPKHGTVLVTQIVRHGTDALTGEPMTQVTDVGGSVDGLVTGLVLGKRKGPLTVDMPAAYPMHGEVSTSVNYRMLRRKGGGVHTDVARRAGAVRGAGLTRAHADGRRPLVRRAAVPAQAQNGSDTGVASTQVLDEVYPSEGEIPTDPLPAYFVNYGDSAGVSIGPGSIKGPDKQYFQIVPLSSSGAPQTSTDCGSAATVLERFDGTPANPPPSTECGVAVRFTPPEAARAHKIYYRATLDVTSGSGADATTIPVTLFGCDARVAEEAGEVTGAGACYQGVNGHEENAAGPEQQQREIEEEDKALEEELTRLEAEEAEEHEIQELKEELEEFKVELEALKLELELEEAERLEEIEEELGELYDELELFEELPQTPEIVEIEEEILDEIDELTEDLEEEAIGSPEGGEGGEGSAAAGEEYEDPSGVVYAQTPEGPVPLPHATVTLRQSFDSAGPFQAVPNESAVMSPANRTNPGTTNAGGLFGWDVLAGYYTIEASKTGCASQTTSVLSIPPPVSNLELTLTCTNPPTRSATNASVSSSAPTSEYGQPVTFTAKVGGGTSPTGTVTFDDGGASIGDGVLQNGEAKLTLSTLAPGAHSITVSYSGDGANRPASSEAIAQTVKGSGSEETACPAGPTECSGPPHAPIEHEEEHGGGSGGAGTSGGGGSTATATCDVTLASPHLSVIVKGSHATTEIDLHDTGSGMCTGKLTLEIAVKIKHSKHKRVKHETIATGSFSIAAGKTGTVKLVLDRAGMTLLRKDHGRLTARLTLSGSSASPPQTRSVLLVKQKSKQPKRH